MACESTLSWLTHREATAFEYAAAIAKHNPDGDLVAIVAQAYIDAHPSKIHVVEPEDVAPPQEPMCKQGDVWRLGRHVIHCADSLAVKGTCDIIFTDPPYGVNYVSRVDEDRRKNWGAIANDHLVGKELEQFIRERVRPKEARYAFVCCDWNCYPAFERALGKPKSVCVWDKGHFGLGMGYRRQHEFVMFYGTLARTDLSDVWPFKREASYQHPTQKPVALVAKALQDVQMPNAWVFDPFLGSGSTLLACEQLGMTCVGAEIEPKYVDVAIARWEKLSGKKAERQS